ncbi:HigA family addiction module antitoxin [Serpentinimonas barnesii]|uniref:HigA family addiction module antitoxin n=1 Tax=Serpentinimonas barnesii TaxID=1458427 RepID=UPI0005EFAA18|nr:HigA family addiction module antitoxin [Serpentinimonas barnesii]
MDMNNPATPGELLAGWLSDLGVSVTDFAAHVGISRIMLSRLLHGHAGFSADMDLRLAEALGTSPGFWLALQAQRDLWAAAERAKQRKRIERMEQDAEAAATAVGQ